MSDKSSWIEQLRGATAIARDATQSVTEIVESMHHTIGGGPTILGRPFEAITKLMTAPAYGAVKAVTNIVSSGLDLALEQLSPLLNQAGLEQGPLIAALNGVLGDYLEETKNPLAIQMSLRLSNGDPLEINDSSLKRLLDSRRGILVLIHGSSMDDTQWTHEGHNHGTSLAKERNLVPLFLRYNSGLHISENGRQFSKLLEQLMTSSNGQIQELIFVCHSMGGLVARSACLCAQENHQTWISNLRKLVTLGTPHHGAPLERGGNVIDVVLQLSRYSAPLARLGKLRSAGVTDLRYGNVLDEHWQGLDRFAPHGDLRKNLALPIGVECFAVAATTDKEMNDHLFGDGLVPVPSALGRHENSDLDLKFKSENQCVVFGTNHLDLLSSDVVYQKLLHWI
jgi:pimeloyl-ACP methyl ester carboxylesterase